MTISLTERLAKSLSKLSEQAWVDPLTANFWLGQIDPLLSITNVKARVVSVTKDNDFVRVKLKPSLLWQGFKPGQHLQLTVAINGRNHSRSYSIYSAEDGSEYIELGIRKQGLVSGYLHDQLRTGDVLQISQAQGEFTLPDPLSKKLLFIAGGSGITPLYAMLQSALLQNAKADIALIYYGQNYDRLPLGVEIQNLAFNHPNFHLKFSVTQTAPYDSDLSGHFVKAHLDWLTDLNERETYVCGPASLIEAVNHHFKQQQLPPAKFEYFKLKLDSAQGKTKQLAAELSSQHKTLQISNNDTLLNQLEQSGVAVKSGCRMGICHECRCTKTSGVTRNLLTQEVSSEPGPIQLCIHKAETDITLAL